MYIVQYVTYVLNFEILFFKLIFFILKRIKLVIVNLLWIKEKKSVEIINLYLYRDCAFIKKKEILFKKKKQILNSIMMPLIMT